MIDKYFCCLSACRIWQLEHQIYLKFLFLSSPMTVKPNIWKWIMQSEKGKAQGRSTQPRKRKNTICDINLSKLKDSYEQKLINIQQYQKCVRAISYTYGDVLDTATNADDND